MVKIRLQANVSLDVRELASQIRAQCYDYEEYAKILYEMTKEIECMDTLRNFVKALEKEIDDES